VLASGRKRLDLQPTNGVYYNKSYEADKRQNSLKGVCHEPVKDRTKKELSLADFFSTAAEAVVVDIILRRPILLRTVLSVLVKSTNTTCIAQVKAAAAVR